MNQDIILNDGEIAVVFDEASIIMNVNTAFELLEKLNGAGNKQNAGGADTQDNNANTNKDKDLQNTNEFKAPEPVAQRPSQYAHLFANVPQVKSTTAACKEKIPVLAFSYNTTLAESRNDLRAGVGKCVKRFDSMAEVDRYYGMASGTASTVANTWLPYIHYTGAMQPTIGGQKNYRFSSKYDGKTLRWSFCPFYNCGYSNGFDRIVVFREDAVPQFILDRYTGGENK